MTDEELHDTLNASEEEETEEEEDTPAFEQMEEPEE
jgi:hypothetical protein